MKLLISLILALFLGGCASSNYSVGKPFNVANVTSITNGKTTKDDLVTLFGQPYMKTPLSATQEKWIYTYVSGTSSVKSYVVTAEVSTSGTQQTLDLFIENGVVVNHTFTDNPLPTVNVN